MSEHRIDTKLIHSGEPQPRAAATMPIHRSTVWAVDGVASYHDLVYPRLNNLPQNGVLGAKLAAIESAEAGLVTASGMAAISTALFAALGEGGHVLVQDCLYGGTHNLLTEDFKQFGLSFDLIDSSDPSTWAAAVKPNTRAVYVEALTNPLQQVIDHSAVVEFARAHGLVSMIDNTFASPVNFRPAEHGYDLSLHSATKYLNGHSDLVAGAVIGKAKLVEQVLHRLNHLGGCLDPHGCYLLYRGLRTLALRVERQNRNAMQMAEFLAQHDAVTAVHYPGLPSHPHHARAAALFDGFGGMLSFELAGGGEATARLLAALQIPIVGPSLGGPETLLTQPARTSHAGLTAAQRAAMGIGDDLVRMSVGIEAVEDLVADFERALGAVGTATAGGAR